MALVGSISENERIKIVSREQMLAILPVRRIL